MSLSRVDARFLLPEPVVTARVAEPEWFHPLTEAGVQVVSGAGPVQVAIGSRRCLPALLRSDAAAILLEGRGARHALRRHGYHVREYLALPCPARPALLLPLAHHRVAAYGVRTCVVPRTIAKHVRKEIVSALFARGVLPPLRHVVTVALAQPEQPFLVTAAETLGVPRDSAWFVLNGSGDALSRGIFFLFAQGESEPEWALKFARVAGYREPFDRDERGLALAHASGDPVARRAPRLIGRVEVAGMHASVETAAQGRRLDDLLLAPGSFRTKVDAVERVAAWTVEAARATAAPAERLAGELARLDELTNEIGARLPAARGLVARVPPLPAVLQHNDLGAWNIIVRHGEFTAIDWESARRFGLPLWDIWYFLSSALALVERVEEERLGRFLVRLFRGEALTSPILFRWTRRTAEALGVPANAVGVVASLCWLHHSMSHVERALALRRHAPGSNALRLVVEDMPALWLSEPGLGASWRRWSE